MNIEYVYKLDRMKIYSIVETRNQSEPLIFYLSSCHCSMKSDEKGV